MGAGEIWLDLLVIGIGLIATLAIVWVLLRQSRQIAQLPEEPVAVPAPPAPAAAPRVAYPQEERVATRQYAAYQLDAPAPLLPALQQAWVSPPRLEAVELVLLSADELRLSLQNQGGELYLLSFDPADHNEVVIHIEENQRRYPEGAALRFRLIGRRIVTRTYQFLVHYSDAAGQLYRQEIAGMGREKPILEAPRLDDRAPEANLN
jgi:hypothetical protein